MIPGIQAFAHYPPYKGALTRVEPWVKDDNNNRTTIITIEGDSVAARDASLGMVLFDNDVQMHYNLHFRRNTYQTSRYIPICLSNEENQ